MSNQVIEFLQSRRSVVANKIQNTPPTKQHLQDILSCGVRVPDHSNVQPWRIVVIDGEARLKFSEQVVLPAAKQRARDSSEPLSDTMQALEIARMQRSPVVIAVLFKPVIPHKIPLWEQQLSAGAVCTQLLNAAQSLNYAAQWLTEWCAYDRSIIKALGGDGEHDMVAGFIHIGKKAEQPLERKRPLFDDIVSYWN